ncbi:MAG: hypothetical protein SVW57_01920 [Thermodesulfobacteriota bacterium]|nr:hypothetical protein [Thermodesulfobacteriota bacterium]
MEKTLNNPLTRREFLKGSLAATLYCGAIPSLILKPGTTFALSPFDVEEPCKRRSGGCPWKALSELTAEELENYKMDPTPWEKTPRDKKYPYVAKKLEPPYTATEIVYMLTVGQYFPWWTHEAPIGGMMISNRGGINFYTGQREVWSALTPDTLEDYLFRWPEDKVYMWIWDRHYTPIRDRYYKLLQNAYRCGKTFNKYSEKWAYFGSSQKTKPVGEASYSDKYWRRDFTYGDTLMVPWYYTWRFIGVDVLYEDNIVRFPNTRNEITIRNWDGKPVKKKTDEIKIMGDDYPAYTKDGGVPCYVLEGVTNSEFFTPQHCRLILWVDMYAHRELRRERYDLHNNLAVVMEKRNRLEFKDNEQWGYSVLINLAWDIGTDHMSVNHYDFHRPPRTFTVDPENPDAYFRPNPVVMTSEMFPVPMSTMTFRDPDLFYLRPRLMAHKFPQERECHVSNKCLKLIKEQNKQEKLDFL